MTIGKVPVTADTYGGYVNVSRQDIDWTQPAIMDIVINDLAGQYAIETEDAAGRRSDAGGDRRADDPDRRADRRRPSPPRSGPPPARVHRHEGPGPR